MSHSHPRRLVLIALAAPVLALPMITPGPSAVGEVAPFPDQVRLPDGFRPEGIAIGSGPTAWFGSLADGDIYEVDLVTGNGTIVSEGPGTSSVGMKVDHPGRLFVAGGPAGDGRVVDTRTGEILAEYPFTDAPSFVNDLVLTRDTAWFTDSQQAQLYGLPLTPDGQLPDVADVVHLPLSGDWVQQPGFNANGIAETPDGSALLVVQSTTGLLFRVDPASGVATVVDLGGASLTAGDGLLVIGRTLYAVQNQLNQVAVVELNRAGTSGEVVDVLTSPLFDVPTTVASFGRSLYLPNARFNTPPTPTTTYTAVRIDR